MDPYYAIFNACYSNCSYKSLFHVHQKYLPFLSSLGIPIEEIVIISFTSSGGVKVVFKSSIPLSKLSNTTYKIDECPGINLIKPFDPTWAFTGLSTASATPVWYPGSSSRMGKKNPQGSPRAASTITPVLALPHILDPAQMTQNIQASLYYNP